MNRSERLKQMRTRSDFFSASGVLLVTREPPPPPPIAVISSAKATDKAWQVRNRARELYLTTHRVELQDSVRQRDALFKKTWRKLGCTQFASLSPLEQKPFLVAARTPRSKKRDTMSLLHL